MFIGIQLLEFIHALSMLIKTSQSGKHTCSLEC